MNLEERLARTRSGERDGVTGPWWINFEAMLSDGERDRIGLFEDRGAVLCITRLCAALTAAEAENERLKAELELAPDGDKWVPRMSYEQSVNYGIDQCNRADAAEAKLEKAQKVVEAARETEAMMSWPCQTRDILRAALAAYEATSEEGKR